MKNTLMIDLETTGQRVGCKVLSLGAFGFDKDGNQVEFYRVFETSAQQLEGLTDDESTIQWWNTKVDPEARAAAFSGTTSPQEGIAEFKKWFYENFSAEYGDWFKVWCCGLDFDFPILQEFFRRFGFTFPWKFWEQYDYRTVKNIFPAIKADEDNVAKHTALEDAKAQMRGLRNFYDKLLSMRKAMDNAGLERIL